MILDQIRFFEIFLYFSHYCCVDFQGDCPFVGLLGSKNFHQHFSVSNNKNYSVTLFIRSAFCDFLTMFLIIWGCFCWFLWTFLECYSFNLVHEDVLKKVMILLQKGIHPIFCSFGNCCFCVLTSEDWDALSALYWSTLSEILVPQNLLWFFKKWLKTFRY